MSSYVPSEEEKEKFMSRAIELGKEGLSKRHGSPFGAVVVKDGKIIGEGYNRVLVDLDASAHGDVIAIKNAAKALGKWQLQGCMLFTSCEPCPMCGAVIWFSGLDKVFYAQPNEGSPGPVVESQKDILQFVNTPMDKRSIPGEQVKSKAKEALSVLDKFFKEEFLLVNVDTMPQ